MEFWYLRCHWYGIVKARIQASDVGFNADSVTCCPSDTKYAISPL